MIPVDMFLKFGLAFVDFQSMRGASAFPEMVHMVILHMVYPGLDGFKCRAFGLWPVCLDAARKETGERF